MRIVARLMVIPLIALLFLSACDTTPTSTAPTHPVNTQTPTQTTPIVQPPPSSVPPLPSETTQPAITPFPEPPQILRLGVEEDRKLRGIVLADSKIRELIKDKSYDFTVSGQQVKGEDWNLSVGVILKDGLTNEQRQKFIQGSLAGQTEHSLVAKYMGILVVGDMVLPLPGYVDVYDVLINYQQTKVESITLEPRSDKQIPQLTLDERKQAVTLALNDTRLQGILKDKSYQVAPTGVHVALDNNLNKEGAAFEIWLDGKYSIDVSGTGKPQQGSVLAVSVNLATKNVSIRVQGGPS